MRCWVRIWLPVMRRTGWVMRAFAISMERYITAYGTDLLIHSLQACADFRYKHVQIFNLLSIFPLPFPYT